MTIHTYAGLAVIITVAVLIRSNDNKRFKRLPPGPRQLPIIGNLFNYPKEKAWLTFAEWKKQYGDVVYINILGKPMIVLNSLKACSELMDKRSAKYSDRPYFVMSQELMGLDYNLVLMGYSHRWRYQRRLFHFHFNETTSLSYHHIQERCTDALLRRILETPNEVQDHIRMLFAESFLEIVYGITPKSRTDSFVMLVEDAVHAFSQGGVPGRWLVNTIPFLKYVPSWMPGADFQRLAKVWKKSILDSVHLPAAYVQKALEEGTARPSVLVSLLTGSEEDEDTGEDVDSKLRKEEAINACSVAYAAGADSTIIPVQVFLLAMANNPEYQKVAQSELDAVVGDTRLPKFQDMDDLPYIVSITKELLRWHSVLPLGIPHALTEDDEYEGHFLPKGSMILPNSWALLHDPEVYPDPEVFNPQRWLLETPYGRKLNTDVPDPDAAFGYGRRQVNVRSCPGQHYARAALFITVANILACYYISPLDESSQPAERVQEGVTDGLLSNPLDYNVSIVPRSDKVAHLIKDTASFA